LLAGAGLIIAFGPPAVALGADPATDEARIQAIEQQIQVLQEELRQVKADLGNTKQQLNQAQQATKKAQADAQNARDAATTAAASAPQVSFPNGRPTISSADKRFSLALGTLTQLDAGYYFQNDHSNDIQPPGARELNDGVNLRRGRLYIVSKLDDFTFNITPDFGGSPDGTVSLYEANLNYNFPVFGNPVTATIGYFKPWDTLQDSQSSADFLFLERPSITEIARNVAAGDARASLGAKSSTDDYFAAAYLTGGTWGDQSGGLLNGEQLGGVLRLATRPLYGDDWNIHTGFSGSYVFRPQRSNAHQPGQTVETLQLRDRPELRIDMNRLIDTGQLPTDTADTWGFELAANWHNFLVQGEYIRIDVNRNDASAVHFQGGYVEGSWVITGESRKYIAAQAAYARPVPAHPFNPLSNETGWGAWELAARYSLTDLNDQDVNGGRQSVYGLSLSWYPNNILRFLGQLDYVDVDRHENGTQVGQSFWDIALRSQVAF
jgi:phosphate-selective porin OprO/OprP